MGRVCGAWWCRDQMKRFWSFRRRGHPCRRRRRALSLVPRLFLNAERRVEPLIELALTVPLAPCGRADDTPRETRIRPMHKNGGRKHIGQVPAACRRAAEARAPLLGWTIRESHGWRDTVFSLTSLDCYSPLTAPSFVWCICRSWRTSSARRPSTLLFSSNTPTSSHTRSRWNGSRLR